MKCVKRIEVTSVTRDNIITSAARIQELRRAVARYRAELAAAELRFSELLKLPLVGIWIRLPHGTVLISKDGYLQNPSFWDGWDGGL